MKSVHCSGSKNEASLKFFLHRFSVRISGVRKNIQCFREQRKLLISRTTIEQWLHIQIFRKAFKEPKTPKCYKIMKMQSVHGSGSKNEACLYFSLIGPVFGFRAFGKIFRVSEKRKNYFYRGMSNVGIFNCEPLPSIYPISI